MIVFFSDELLQPSFRSRPACIVLPSGESVYNNRKINTTQTLHALVHHVYVISKELRTILLEATMLMQSLHFFCDI